MDILKKSLRTVIAVMALTLFAACNFELKNDGSQPSPQKEETVKELAATYVIDDENAAALGIEMKIDFYTDGSFLAYDDVMDEEGASIALVGLYKGTYEGNASEDGTLKIKTIDCSDVAEVIETESLLSLMSEIEAAIAAAGENAELPIKYEVKWSAYDDNEEKSYTVAKGKLNIFDADFIRDGYVPDETEPVDEPIETPVEDPEEKPDDTEINKTLVAKYASKKDSVTGLILTVEFYSDGTWLAYDDIHGAETSADSEGNSESKEYTFAYVDLYKGTYTGKPAEDGKITIVTTHNTVISNLRSISTIYDYYGEVESNIGKDAELPVRFTDTWLSSVKVETEVTISKGKMNVFDTDLYKDGKYEDESEAEVTKEIVARFLGQDPMGQIFIELYKDGSFLEYDIIDFGDGVSVQLDLYKGKYEGKPAEDGNISFNITQISTILKESYESQVAMMKAQLLEAGENAVYPVKFKGDWQAVSQSATVTVKNGKATVLGFQVVREGTIAELETPFSEQTCTETVSKLALSDGNWKLKQYLEVENQVRVIENLYPELLKKFSESEQVMINSWKMSDAEIEERGLTPYSAGYIFLTMPGKSINIYEYDFNVDNSKEGNAENKITVKEKVSTLLNSYEGNELVKDVTNVLYDLYQKPRPVWNGNYCLVLSEKDSDLEHNIGWLADLVISGSERYEVKSDSQNKKFFVTEKYIKDKNSIYIMKNE